VTRGLIPDSSRKTSWSARHSPNFCSHHPRKTGSRSRASFCSYKCKLAIGVRYLFPIDPLCLEKLTQLYLGHFYLKKFPNIIAVFVEVGIRNVKNHPQNFLHINGDREGVVTSLNAGIQNVGLRVFLTPPSTSPNLRYFALALRRVRSEMPQAFAADSSVMPCAFKRRASCLLLRGAFSNI
jgi:hypothetical protein